jgi:hypothetical protein
MSIIQGGVVGQGNIQRELQDGINAIVDTYRSYPTEYSKIFSVQKSEKAYEEDVIRTGTALLQVKPEGQAINYDSYSEVGLQRYVHVNYGLGVAITEEAIDDNLYINEMSKAGALLGDSEMKTKETIAAQLFDNGYGTTTFTSWDGLAMFSASHLIGKGGTFSNMLSTPSALNQAAIESAIVAISRFKNTSGLLAMVKAKKLVVPSSDVFIAERILGSYLQSDNANNNINALQSLGMFSEGWMVNHYLTNQTNWFITTDVPEGLKFFQRAQKSGSDNDFNTSDYRHKVTTRFSLGCTDVRGVFGSGNAGS